MKPASGHSMPISEMNRDALGPGTIVSDPSATGDSYEVLEVISSESDFSFVYRVTDRRRGDEAVLKEFFPHADVRRVPGGAAVLPRLPAQAPHIADALRQFRREGDLMQRIDHPNIVKARGSAFDAHGTSYLAMDLVSGKTLIALIARLWDPLRRTAPDPEWAQALLESLLGALESLHNLGIIHRDIKPANIIVPIEGLSGDPRRMTLLDFGSAIQLGRSGSNQLGTIETSKTVLRERGGHTRLPFSPEYAPTEIALRQFVGPPSDLYAVGATFYEFLTGDKPIVANYRQQYLLSNTAKDPQEKLVSRPELVGHYKANWLDALDRALALNAIDRPSSVEALRELMQRETVSTSRITLGRLISRIVIAALVLATLVYGANYLVLKFGGN